jgi:bifunctional NMN adenylyltransferase/nudix hydrolase
MKLFKDNTDVGVIISRMQVPYLTESHTNLIKSIQARHQSLIVLLGVSGKKDLKNPFDFLFRKQMISPLLRETDTIIPLPDIEDNKVWVQNVDLIISSLTEKAILYGGRDSFIPYYKKDKGKFETQELLPEDNDSGTELRNIASVKIPQYSKEVAEAIIYTINQLK